MRPRGERPRAHGVGEPSRLRRDASAPSATRATRSSRPATSSTGEEEVRAYFDESRDGLPRPAQRADRAAPRRRLDRRRVRPLGHPPRQLPRPAADRPGVHLPDARDLRLRPGHRPDRLRAGLLRHRDDPAPARHRPRPAEADRPGRDGPQPPGDDRPRGRPPGHRPLSDEAAPPLVALDPDRRAGLLVLLLGAGTYAAWHYSSLILEPDYSGGPYDLEVQGRRPRPRQRLGQPARPAEHRAPRHLRPRVGGRLGRDRRGHRDRRRGRHRHPRPRPSRGRARSTAGDRRPHLQRLLPGQPEDRARVRLHRGRGRGRARRLPGLADRPRGPTAPGPGPETWAISSTASTATAARGCGSANGIRDAGLTSAPDHLPRGRRRAVERGRPPPHGPDRVAGRRGGGAVRARPRRRAPGDGRLLDGRRGRHPVHGELAAGRARPRR